MGKSIIQSDSGDKQFVWSAGDDTSDPTRLSPGRVFSLYLPTSFQGTAVTIEVAVSRTDSKGNVTKIWKPLYQDSVPLTIAVTADTVNILPADIFAGIDEVRFVSDAAESNNPIATLLMST